MIPSVFILAFIGFPSMLYHCKYIANIYYLFILNVDAQTTKISFMNQQRTGETYGQSLASVLFCFFVFLFFA